MSIFSNSGHLKIVETSGSLMSLYKNCFAHFIDTYRYLLSPNQNLSVERSQPLICKAPGDLTKFNDLGRNGERTWYCAGTTRILPGIKGKKKVKVHRCTALRLCTGRTAHRGSRGIGKGKVHRCTGTEALYRPYGP